MSIEPRFWQAMHFRIGKGSDQRFQSRAVLRCGSGPKRPEVPRAVKSKNIAIQDDILSQGLFETNRLSSKIRAEQKGQSSYHDFDQTQINSPFHILARFR